MAFDLGTLFATLEFRTDAWNRGVNDAKKDLGTLRTEAEATSRKLDAFANTTAAWSRTLATGLAAVAGAMAVATKRGVDFNLTVDRGTAGLTQLTGSAEKARKFMADLTAEAQKSTNSLKDLIPIANGLAASYGPEGLGKVIPTMRAFGDTAAALGVRADGLERALMGLRQMIGKGKPAQEELNQITENLPGLNVRKILLANFKTADPELLAKAKVTGEQVADAIVRGMQKQFGGAQAKMANSLPGVLNNLGDAADQVAGKLTRDFVPKVTGGLQKVLTAFGRLSDNKSSIEALKKPFDDVADAIVRFTNKVADTIDWFNKLSDTEKRHVVQQVETAAKIAATTAAALAFTSVAAKIVSSVTTVMPHLKTLANLLAGEGGVKGAAVLGTSGFSGGIAGALGQIALIGATAFAGWEFGKTLDNLFSLSDRLSDILLKMQGIQDIKDKENGYSDAPGWKQAVVRLRRAADIADARGGKGLGLDGNNQTILDEADVALANPIALRHFKSGLGGLTTGQWRGLAQLIEQQYGTQAGVNAQRRAVGVATRSGESGADFAGVVKHYNPKLSDAVAANIGKAVQDAAATYGIDPAILLSMLKTESNFNPRAVGPAVKGGRARGIAQIMPFNLASLGITDPFDPRQSIMGGAKYLSQMLQERGVHGDIRLALAAYNAGPGAVRKAGGIPGNAETQAYVPAIMNRAESIRGMLKTGTSVTMTKDGPQVDASGGAGKSLADDIVEKAKSLVNTVGSQRGCQLFINNVTGLKFGDQPLRAKESEDEMRRLGYGVKGPPKAGDIGYIASKDAPSGRHAFVVESVNPNGTVNIIQDRGTPGFHRISEGLNRSTRGMSFYRLDKFADANFGAADDARKEAIDAQKRHQEWLGKSVDATRKRAELEIQQLEEEAKIATGERKLRLERDAALRRYSQRQANAEFNQLDYLARTPANRASINARYLAERKGAYQTYDKGVQDLKKKREEDAERASDDAISGFKDVAARIGDMGEAAGDSREGILEHQRDFWRNVVEMIQNTTLITKKGKQSVEDALLSTEGDLNKTRLEALKKKGDAWNEAIKKATEAIDKMVGPEARRKQDDKIAEITERLESRSLDDSQGRVRRTLSDAADYRYEGVDQDVITRAGAEQTRQDLGLTAPDGNPWPKRGNPIKEAFKGTERFFHGLATSFGDAIGQMIVYGGNLKSWWKGMLSSLAGELTSTLVHQGIKAFEAWAKGAKLNIAQVAGALLQVAGAAALLSKKKRKGGLLGGLLAGVASFLIPGLGFTVGTFLEGAAIGGELFKAGGGPVTAGQPYIVGEKGPELFVPQASGNIVPNSQLLLNRLSGTFASRVVTGGVGGLPGLGRAAQLSGLGGLAGAIAMHVNPVSVQVNVARADFTDERHVDELAQKIHRKIVSETKARIRSGR